MNADPTRYEEECHRCGAAVEAFTRQCPNCGFRRDTFEMPVDPEFACIECGEEAHNHRCGCCGFPLCSMHHELGAGFCSKSFSVSGVPVCLRAHNVHAGAGRHESIVLTTADTDVFHLPDEEESGFPACDPDAEEMLELKLKVVKAEFDREMCPRCATEARARYRLFHREIAAEFGDDQEVAADAE